ncbi:Proline dehydrogenase 1 [Fusarium oxysporum f. sp. albedinis]|nr:Proline dehydrogenase 1 [Fusarium oxysporum f. sp. albedinis]
MTKTHCNWAVSSFSDSYRKEKWERHLQNKISGDYTQTLPDPHTALPNHSHEAVNRISKVVETPAVAAIRSYRKSQRSSIPLNRNAAISPAQVSDADQNIKGGACFAQCG